jgi:hypothetical protein
VTNAYDAPQPIDRVEVQPLSGADPELPGDVLAVLLAQSRAPRVLKPLYDRLPLKTLDEAAIGRPAPFYRDWLDHNEPGDAFWEPRGSHPRFARNTGSGEPLAAAMRLVAADQTVFHDPARPSAVILPVGH